MDPKTSMAYETENEIKDYYVSLGDVIDLGLDFDLYRDRSNF